MAACTAACAAFASFTVALFWVLSSPRIAVASAMAFVRSATSFESCAVLAASDAIVASPSSTAALRPSMSSLSLLRVILLFPSSLSQNPSWSASPCASSRRRSSIAEIIFLTLAKGSAATFWARSSKCLLWRRAASAVRNSRIRLWMPSEALAWWSPICTRAVPPDFACAMLRYCSAFPSTSGDDRISMALPMASISSSRSFCFSA
mmetsp:Transcript_115462/g.307039  ORF Transcript_115462/g.307039 Transcript_115462/m.307039 type:complete len:206 (-) Transcript_115462:1019-1636(-)